jgi:hypothetical protein
VVALRRSHVDRRRDARIKVVLGDVRSATKPSRPRRFIKRRKLSHDSFWTTRWIVPLQRKASVATGLPRADESFKCALRDRCRTSNARSP